jgi:hypothetical protein
VQFTGERLRQILLAQVTRVAVVDFLGRVFTCVSGPEVVCRFTLDGFVGVGNHSRVRYVKPEGVRYRPERFGSERQVRAHFDESGRLRQDVELNHIGRDRKTWPQQPSRAKTSKSGRITQLHIGVHRP